MSDMRLIDANAVVTIQVFDEMTEEYNMETITVAKAIDRWSDEGCPPTIDAVPVVRCRECRRHLPSTESDGFLYCRFWRTRTLPSGFCHMGARKDGGATDA